MLTEDATLVVIDVQERLVPAIHNAASMVMNVKKCIMSSGILGLPIVYTEQYPQGLGSTVNPLADELAGAPCFEKTTFSCCGSPGFTESIRSKHVLLTGIETHVCVYQTARELLDNGFKVTIAEDAVSSRNEIDHQRALSNLEKRGVYISTFECLFMNLLKDSRHPSFKEISAVLKL